MLGKVYEFYCNMVFLNRSERWVMTLRSTYLSVMVDSFMSIVGNGYHYNFRFIVV